MTNTCADSNGIYVDMMLLISVDILGINIYLHSLFSLCDYISDKEVVRYSSEALNPMTSVSKDTSSKICKAYLL